MKKLLIFLTAFSLFFPTFAHAEEAKTFDLEAGSAIIVNPNTDEILFEKNADEQLSPASLTKVMTLLLVSEEMQKRHTKDSELAKISKKAWQTDGSKMFLQVDKEVPVGELKKGLAIVSGNDAAVALAEHFFGSTDKFVEKMNERAKELGMTNTHFVTVNGLSKGKDGDLSTARDLSILTRYYVKHFPQNMELHKTKSYTTLKKYAGGRENITQQNRNPLLGSYKGVDGLKTGFVDGHYNLIATAKQGDIRLIAVTMKSPTDTARARAGYAILNYGFNQYQTINKGNKGDAIETLNVYKASNAKQANVVLGENATFVVNKKDIEAIKVKDHLPKYLKGGVKKGEKIGERVVTVHDKTYKFNIVVTEDLKPTNVIYRLFDSIAIMFNKYVLGIF